MKMNRILLITTALLALFGSGCWVPTGVERGSGAIVKEERQVSGFNGIVFELSGNVYISQNGREALTLETDDNIIQHIKTEVKDGKLTIRSDKSISPKRFNVYISVKGLNDLTLSGSGNIYADTQINTSALELVLSGSGNITFPNLNSKETRAEISGSGNIEFNGIGENCIMEIDGSGNLNCFDYVTQNCNVKINGSGNAQINVKTGLNAQINGSGDVLYRGAPKSVKSEVNGSGKIKSV